MPTQLEDFNEIDLINLNKLKEVIGTEICWYPHIIELEDIYNMIHNVKEINEQYRDFEEKSKEWHIGRVKYFVNNSDKITPVIIDDNCCGNIQILDGCHRYMAKLFLKHESIECEFSGLVNTLEWLKN